MPSGDWQTLGQLFLDVDCVVDSKTAQQRDVLSQNGVRICMRTPFLLTPVKKSSSGQRGPNVNNICEKVPRDFSQNPYCRE